MSYLSRRILTFIITVCLFATQTAQAYTQAELQHRQNGGINLNAGRDLQLLAAMNGSASSHQETLSTDGMNADPTADRRKNNKQEIQNQTAQVTSLTSQGNITTHSGRNTRIEASILDAQGAIDISAGDATTQGNITFATVKDTTYTAVTDSHSSATMQGQSGHGDYKETVKLANINAGKGLTVNATGTVTVETPEVPAEAAPPEPPAPAPHPVTTCHHGHCTTHYETTPVPEKPKLTPEQQAKADAEQKAHDQQRFDDHIQNLASQPGQAWIAQLAQDPKTKVQWQQVHAAAQHWEYAHEGITPEMAGVIAIAVAYCTAGAGAGVVGTVTSTSAESAALTYGTTVAVILQAGITTLATQASIALINNKGDLGKTLNDLGQSSNVKALALAMVTAGALQGVNSTFNLNGTAKSEFTDLLKKNIVDNVASATINHAINGGDLQQQLEQSLKTAFIDTGAAKGANLIGDLWQNGKLNDFTHKLAHAVAGCAAGAASNHDCSSGALGAVVGEIAAEAYAPNGGAPLTPQQQTDTVNFSRLMAGIAAALTGGDVNLAAGAGGNAAENNRILHFGSSLKAVNDCQGSNSAECQTIRQMTDTRSGMPVAMPSDPLGQHVVANFDTNNNVVSYTVLDRNNQPTFIMEPTDFFAYAQLNSATQGSMLLSPQWSLDMFSSMAYVAQGDTTRAFEHQGYVFSSPEYWLTAGTAYVGGAMTFVRPAMEVAGAGEVATAGGGSTQPSFIFRGDARSPDVILSEGFQPRGANTDLYNYALNNEPSVYVPTTTSPNVARDFASMQGNGYVYTIRRQSQGIDVNATLGNLSPFPNELEIAVPGGIQPLNIMGVRAVAPNGNFTGPFIKNPLFTPQKP